MQAKRLAMVTCVGLALLGLGTASVAHADNTDKRPVPKVMAKDAEKHKHAHGTHGVHKPMTVKDRRRNLVRDWCNGTLQNEAGDANYPPTPESIEATRSRRAGRPIPGDYGKNILGYENGCP